VNELRNGEVFVMAKISENVNNDKTLRMFK
jgi:hypothetical protein